MARGTKVWSTIKWCVRAGDQDVKTSHVDFVDDGSDLETQAWTVPHHRHGPVGQKNPMFIGAAHFSDAARTRPING
jgi:hypothetical protein